MNDKVSALLDGELSTRECTALLDDIAKNPHLGSKWERYHLIGAALRSDLGTLVKADLADRISAQIHSEPSTPARSIIVRFPIWKVAKITTGFAIAASVAAVAIVSFQSTSIFGPSQVQVLASAPEKRPVIESPPTTSQLAKSQQDSSLNALLVKHNEFKSSASMSGMMSYVRVVSQNGDQ